MEAESKLPPNAELGRVAYSVKFRWFMNGALKSPYNLIISCSSLLVLPPPLLALVISWAHLEIFKTSSYPFSIKFLKSWIKGPACSILAVVAKIF